MPAPADPRVEPEDDDATSRLVSRMKPRRLIVWAVCASIWLSGCASTTFNLPEGRIDEAAYVSVYPWFAEFCALSEIDKKPGFGAEIVAGGPGGHSVLYLNGVCLVKGAGYPVVALCGPGDPKPGQGVGLSVNDHYRNANWIATEGRDFLYHGDLAPGEPLNREAYLRTEKQAEAMGILDGVTFHSRFLDERPASMSETDFMYDLSVATDYAIDFGRDRYCARVPLDRARMQAAVGYLNAVNAPYRSGQQVFNWNVFQNNCTHLAHNILAMGGLWPIWPTDRPLLISLFDFPVPKNEFVNLMRRTNDLPIADPDAMDDDASARAVILRQGWIPTRPGGLAEAEHAVPRNDVYNTRLRLIFYDEPTFGHYKEHFDAIFKDPRYTSLSANLNYFASSYDAILARRPGTGRSVMAGPDPAICRRASLDRVMAGPGPAMTEDQRCTPNADRRAMFYLKYHATIAAEKAKLDEAHRLLSVVPGQRS
jgi:hypothetical protein